jgi:hypothetical protein
MALWVHGLAKGDAVGAELLPDENEVRDTCCKAVEVGDDESVASARIIERRV